MHNLQHISFTPSAVVHIKAQLAKQSDACGFYLSVKKTGCSGYTFVPEIVSESPANAVHFVTDEGLTVFLAKESMALIEGIQVDLVIDSAGLKQKKLVFIHPKETGRCGCGESFTID